MTWTVTNNCLEIWMIILVIGAAAWIFSKWIDKREQRILRERNENNSKYIK